MKSFFVLFFAFLSATSAAQDFRVSVRDKNGPLPYANVYVNDVQLAITDSLGKTTIPAFELKKGYVVSSTYIGMTPAYVTYDGAIRECVLTLIDELSYTIVPISVNALDGSGWRAFRKYALQEAFFIYDCTVDGRFSIAAYFADGASRSAVGSFVMENHVPLETRTHRGNFIKYHFNLPPQIQTSDDTTRLDTLLSHSIPSVFSMTCRTIGHLGNEHYRRGPYSGMSYLGFENGRHYFRYAYSSPNLDYNHQYLFTVNAKTKRIETIRYQTVSKRDDRWSYTGTVSADFRTFTNKKPRIPEVSVPTHIIYHMELPDVAMELTLSDLTIKIPE
ncbi:MAG: hypothetical protein LBU80_03040 [Rikenellaceae bacterium]|jgi:hypothetical protein|nr:hypothetical protein [Rikenellaceae bacterium]